METVEITFGPLRPGAGPFLCDQLAALLANRPDAAVVVCDVSAVERPTPADLDHLAQVRLAARRVGRDLVLRGVGPRPQLVLVLVLTGLGGVFGGEAGEPSSIRGVGGESHGQPP
ncbi:STAS domain-containing protein [Streptomyces smyrnaeus]|uniref:STAS domain-containing protein n=1 Tax=Streptomyces smyrnaeus TaxID=1387713 RepID=UPI003407F104